MANQGSLIHSNQNLFSNAPPYLSYFIFLFFVSIVTVILDHKYQKLEQVRSVINTLLSPVYFIAEIPAQANVWIGNNLVEREKLLAEKQKLITDNLQLAQRTQKYQALEVKNQHLRDLLKMSKRYQHDKAQVANVLRLDKNRNPNEITLDKGSTDGVYLGQAVLDKSGVLGRVVHTSYRNSTALLLTSPKSFTPAQVVRNSYRTTAIGNGLLNNLELSRIPEGADIQIGDIVSTSGIGGIFPKDYIIGKVSVINIKQDHFLQIIVEPFANHQQIEEVLLIWPVEKFAELEKLPADLKPKSEVVE